MTEKLLLDRRDIRLAKDLSDYSGVALARIEVIKLIPVDAYRSSQRQIYFYGTINQTHRTASKCRRLNETTKFSGPLPQATIALAFVDLLQDLRDYQQ